MKHDTRSQSSSTRSPRRFSISSHVIPGLMIGFDSLVILASAIISYTMIVGNVEDPSYYAAAAAFVWIVTIMLLNFGGLYEFDPIMKPLSFLDKIVIAFATTFLFLLAAAFSLKISTEFSRIWIGIFAISASTGLILFRFGASLIVARLAEMRVLSRNVIIVGTGKQASELLRHLEKSNQRFISMLGIFAENLQSIADELERYPMLGTVDSLASYVRANTVDDVIICLPWSEENKISMLVATLRELPVNVYLGSDLIGFRLPLRSPPEHFGGMPLVEVMGRPLAGWGAVQKAALDYGLGIILILLLFPVMVLIAVAIKLESKGPLLFRQERYGFVNKVFRIYKFRTMVHAANPDTITIQAIKDDPRVTRVGRVLRRWSLDELPQLINVLEGTMSLVGPRPHSVDHNEAFAQTIRGYFARHRVKPGLTGWAQVNGLRGETRTLEAMQTRVKYDIYYVENWSLLLDLKILAMTFVVCLTGRNAY